jgi:hypothetical protein
MYIVTPSEPIYHLPQSESLTLCGLSFNPEHQKRRDDLRLSETIPDKQFTLLCSECQRVSTGAPKSEGAPLELLSPSRFIDTPI